MKIAPITLSLLRIGILLAAFIALCLLVCGGNCDHSSFAHVFGIFVFIVLTAYPFRHREIFSALITFGALLLFCWVDITLCNTDGTPTLLPGRPGYRSCWCFDCMRKDPSGGNCFKRHEGMPADSYGDECFGQVNSGMRPWFVDPNRGFTLVW